MNQCLNTMEARLTDLLHTGLDTGAGDSAAGFRRLAEQCEALWAPHRSRADGAGIKFIGCAHPHPS